MNFSLRDILNKFFINLSFIIIFTIIISGLIILYYLKTPKIYKSDAKILVKLGFEQSGTLSFLNVQQNVYISKRKQDLKNEAEIFQSDKVLKETAKVLLKDKANDEKLLLKTVRRLKKNLKVKPLYETDTLKITYKDISPFLAQKTLNIMLKKYIDFHIKVYSSSKVLKLLENEVKNYKKKFEELQYKLTEFMKKNDFYGDQNQLKLLLQIKNQILNDLIKTMADYQYSLEKVKKLKELKKSIKEYILANVSEIRNKNRELLKSKLREAEIEKQSLLLRYQPESRFVRDINKEINILKKLLMLEPKYVISRKDKQVNNSFKVIQEMLFKYETELSGYKSKINIYRSKLEEINRKIKDYITNTSSYEILNKELNLTKKLYENFSKNLSETKLKIFSEKQKILNISVIESPSLNIVPVWPNVKYLGLIGIMLIFTGNFVILILSSVFDRKIRFPDDIERIYPNKLCASFPYLKKMRKIDLNDDLFKRFPREYQRIYYKLKDSKMTIMTTCTKGEGTTTISVNLLNFIKKYYGKKLVYVTFTPIKSESKKGNIFPLTEKKIMSIFKNEYGVVFCCFKFSEKVEDALFNNLEKIKKFLNALKEKYDFVLIDFSSINKILEISYLIDIVDSYLIVVEAEKIKKEVLEFNVNIIKDYNISLNNLFFILNKRKFYIPKFLIKYV